MRRHRYCYARLILPPSRPSLHNCSEKFTHTLPFLIFVTKEQPPGPLLLVCVQICYSGTITLDQKRIKNRELNRQAGKASLFVKRHSEDVRSYTLQQTLRLICSELYTESKLFVKFCIVSHDVESSRQVISAERQQSFRENTENEGLTHSSDGQQVIHLPCYGTADRKNVPIDRVGKACNSTSR
ncbi:hypothetical protein TNCT_732231 [Trichonephila clavata]|uniref:Uncharacterized protein n=1 Tax=Trichonephila clavata TaxID=2740835 RepID=A0A8X6FMP6_TRICU|nr:hypothetical protein TNCT_732231 [Trichonephila clavata]